MRFVRLSFVLWAAAAGAVAVGLYQVKYDVQHLEARLDEVRDQIREDRSALHVLEAEWNRLNRPDRLEHLAEKHLDMGPTQPAQIAAVTQIPPRITREVLSAEERGEAPSLDGIPVPQAKPWSLEPSTRRIARRPAAPARNGRQP
jgi:cell division protein FtsL